MANTQSNKDSETNYDVALVRNVIMKFKKRALYKPVYMVYSRQEGPEAVKIKELIEIYTNPEERYGFQRNVEDLLALPPGSIILYVTKKDLGKVARTRCLWIDGNVKPLDEIGREKSLLKEELENIKRRHEELWRLYVFMDKQLVNECGKYLAGFCKWKLLEINDVEEEEFSKAKPWEDWEIFLDLHVPKDVAVSGLERELLAKKISALRKTDRRFSKFGVPREMIKKEFEGLKGGPSPVASK
jgi:hypothetical protein